MTMNSTGFVLIPGAGLGSWIWRDVVPLLDAPVVAVDFSQSPKATLVDRANEVVEQVTTEKVVLVAHSLGGTIALEAARLLGDRVAGFVAIGAVLPKQGESFVSALPFPQRLVMPLIVRLVGTRPPNSEIRKAYCEDLPAQLADEVIERFTPEPKRVYLDRVQASMPDVPRAYIELTRDKQFTVGQQRDFARKAGIDSIEPVAGGHLAMLSQPAEVAKVLANFHR